MPFITLQYTAAVDAAKAARLASEIADLACTVLRKDPRRTSVLLRPVDASHWFIAGQCLADTGRNAFRLEVTVTDESNTRADKQRFQREAFALLSGLFENLHPHSNVHVIDCRASAYGYGGISQEEHGYRATAPSAPDRT
ncbi:tautomerase family protein [Thiomonas bhubaneswarensis]|uniref:Phenylpyruvate tautomerase PptA, 4-oxalocrotonate tautomerase family n=1 Tax=Thiomonas bhubaneswarensis TaxID=339866 RepID=A0A0K6HZQ9_9BURK|nr:tautomerase family protein [Thiomonas bhubaneswarensis]CUA96394.1 Phenylpyruvate tautomerase PptA, 4-oxalocrotonate tautomerase family [Thiomonas bhubaneswarensis]